MWLTQWRPALMDAYVNYQYMRFEMWPQYQAADLPEALLFGIMAKESGGKVHAVSRSGAAGPLQFMYATGHALRPDQRRWLRSALRPVGVGARQTRIHQRAARPVQQQSRADHCRLQRRRRARAPGCRRRYLGELLRSAHLQPAVAGNARDYVPSVLAAAWLFLHPDSYNLKFPKVDGAPGKVTLKRAASLSELTVCLGSSNGMSDGWFRTLRNLNPRLDPQAEQPAGSELQLPKSLERVYASRCVSGPWPILANDLHTAVIPVVAYTPTPSSPAPKAERRYKVYKVRRGDSLPASCASCSVRAWRKWPI